MITYRIAPSIRDHEWHIRLTFVQDNDIPVEISLPNWVPGSYLIRDFSRHITSIHASCNGTPMPLKQIAKNRWRTAAIRGEWQIRYTVYAFDLSVRGAFLTAERGFFDGACLFLKVEGKEMLPHRLELSGIPEGWSVATTLPETGRYDFQTASYAELIDRPVEMGLIEFLDFEVAGIPHTIALSGIYPDFDRDRLVWDIQKICETELAMFSSPAPFEKYLFLLHVGDHIYGGLEHADSTALLADRHSLPPYPYRITDADDAYTTLLGLFSHEYFHAWNVKSIKPAAFVPYDLDKENYTEQLWAFEGITSYYDDLFLARSRTISPESYLNLLAQGITRVQQTRGRLRQTLAESSFTAWNKFYKPDENSPNAIVSYYQKGALAALCLDLIIRNRSNGRHSLDTVMDKLYREWRDTHSGIPEKHWQIRCQEITGLDLTDFFQTALYSTEDLPLAECLATAGVKLTFLQLPRQHGGGYSEHICPIPPTGDFGARFKQNADHIVLTHVFNGGNAESAELYPQDKIIALDGYACTDFAAQWARYPFGARINIHFFRAGVLCQTVLWVKAAAADTAILHITDRNLLENWLFG